jgi:ABC-type polysaccharide/polyol phosphate export permease
MAASNLGNNRARPVIRPVLTMVVFAVVIGKLAQFAPEPKAARALVVSAGMLRWRFFPTAVTDASNSVSHRIKDRP